MLMFVYHKLCKVISNRFYILVTTLQGYKRHVENQAAEEAALWRGSTCVQGHVS